MLFVAVSALALAGCVTSDIPFKQPGVTGSLAVVAGERHDVFEPTQCASGELYSFYGVELVDATKPYRIRIVDDPITGVHVVTRFDNQQRANIVFDRSVCRVMTIHAAFTGWQVNEVRELAGTADLDCSLPDGSAIHGRVDFKNCH